MKVLSFALLTVLLSFAAIGTAGAQTFGTASDTFTSCGANCVIWQNTESYTVAASGYQLTDMNAVEVQLPQWSGAGTPGGSYLTQAVYDIDGSIEGNLTLTNTNTVSETFGGQTTSVIGVFGTQGSAQSAYNLGTTAAIESGLGSGTLSISTPGSETINAGGNQTFPGVGYYTSSGQIDTDTTTCASILLSCVGVSPYEGNGDYDLWLSSITNQASTGRGGNGSVGGTTYAEDSASITYTFDYDVYTQPGNTPEPVSMALLGSGLACLGLLKRKRFTR